jgi:hypothetical protein
MPIDIAELGMYTAVAKTDSECRGYGSGGNLPYLLTTCFQEERIAVYLITRIKHALDKAEGSTRYRQIRITISARVDVCPNSTNCHTRLPAAITTLAFTAILHGLISSIVCQSFGRTLRMRTRLFSLLHVV